MTNKFDALQRLHEQKIDSIVLLHAMCSFHVISLLLSTNDFFNILQSVSLVTSLCWLGLLLLFFQDRMKRSWDARNYPVRHRGVKAKSTVISEMNSNSPALRSRRGSRVISCRSYLNRSCRRGISMKQQLQRTAACGLLDPLECIQKFKAAVCLFFQISGSVIMDNLGLYSDFKCVHRLILSIGN